MILSVDDGCQSDVRVADLAQRYKIEAIFYWPVEWQSLAYSKGYEPLTYQDAMDIALKHEIGSHTITHRHLTEIPYGEVLEELVGSKEMLETLFPANRVTKFCPPRGYTNKDIDIDVYRIYESQRLTKGEHLVHIHPNSGANGNKPWRDCITDKTTEIWGHSYEFDRYNLWDELEQFLKEQNERR